MRIKDFRAVVDPLCTIELLDAFGGKITYLNNDKPFTKETMPRCFDKIEIVDIGRDKRGFVIGTNFEPITISEYLEQTNSEVQFDGDTMILSSDWGNAIEPINSLDELKECAIIWQIETMNE